MNMKTMLLILMLSLSACGKEVKPTVYDDSMVQYAVTLSEFTSQCQASCDEEAGCQSIRVLPVINASSGNPFKDILEAKEFTCEYVF